MKILVVGDSCKDVFVYGSCDRLCPEGPAPVLKPKYEIDNPGMAGNVHANVIALGCKCELKTNPELIIKKRYIDSRSNTLLLRVDEYDACERIKHLKSYKKYDAILIADYCKGFLEESDIVRIANDNPNVFVDTKKRIGKWADSVRFIKINKLEYELTKSTTGDYIDKLIVTVGPDGCVFLGDHYPAPHKFETIDIAGAGDTFMAAFAIHFMKYKDVRVSIEYAQECTSQVIQKRGVSVVTDKLLAPVVEN